MPSRIEIAKEDILAFFDSLDKRVLERSDLYAIFDSNRRFWRLAKSMSVDKFVEFMLAKSSLKRELLDFPHRRIVKYVWGTVTTFELVMNLRSNCYLTHFTATHLHELTDQIPKMLYVNSEQKPKPKYPSELTQEKINLAFSKPTRLSNNITDYKGYNIRLLNGMFTDNTGVTEITGPDGEKLRVTDVERTLIDITVRPEYAGGVFQVFHAYKKAQPKVSINRLTAILKKLNYIYPYHQAIGFYLEKSGVYSKEQINLLKKFETKFDFYLAHNMKSPRYTPIWQLYYPDGIA